MHLSGLLKEVMSEQYYSFERLFAHMYRKYEHRFEALMKISFSDTITIYMKGQIKKKVFIGLSGGVDSAVSAALLKKEGYEVTGVFIKAWNPPGFVCTWKEDRRSAMRVAAVLDIPFITLDLEKEYKEEVVDYMIKEYKEGNTPNPDVMCNKEIKFGHFLKFALENGADYVATGHYAELSKNKNESEVLREAKDKNKDQSYFLWTLTPDQLKHILFPIGHLEKRDVRKLALKFGLPQATRKDSQGLCFLGKIDMKEFLKEYLEVKTGPVLNEKGEVVGEHDGAILYTIGERHGFRVFNHKTNSEPLYVIKKDIEKNTITVAPKIRPQISNPQGASLLLKDMNLMGEIPKNKKVECRIRYRAAKISCRLNEEMVTFEKPQFDVSPGQSLVFYNGEICLGGGVIVE